LNNGKISWKLRKTIAKWIKQIILLFHHNVELWFLFPICYLKYMLNTVDEALDIICNKYQTDHVLIVILCLFECLQALSSIDSRFVLQTLMNYDKSINILVFETVMKAMTTTNNNIIQLMAISLYKNLCLTSHLTVFDWFGCSEAAVKENNFSQRSIQAICKLLVSKNPGVLRSIGEFLEILYSVKCQFPTRIVYVLPLKEIVGILIKRLLLEKNLDCFPEVVFTFSRLLMADSVEFPCYNYLTKELFEDNSYLISLIQSLRETCTQEKQVLFPKIFKKELEITFLRMREYVYRNRAVMIEILHKLVR
jgi:hypothetical protein